MSCRGPFGTDHAKEKKPMSNAQPAGEAVARQPDLINQLAGIETNDRLAELRHQRPDVAKFIQGSFDTLLEPQDPAGLSRSERELVALRVAILNANPTLAAFHRQRLEGLGVAAATIAAVAAFPATDAFARREAAILQHVDLLTNEPRAASREELAGLEEAGLTTPAIVTLAQLVAYLSFEVRLLAGLRILGEGQ
jgi:CMD domain protein